jgi:hypothetical protein
MQVAVVVIGIIVFVLGVARQFKARSDHRLYQRSAFGVLQSDRHPWSPMRWPEGRAAWRTELKLWFKIAVYSALAGAIFTLVVTH